MTNGESLRERLQELLDEAEQSLKDGYDSVHFAASYVKLTCDMALAALPAEPSVSCPNCKAPLFIAANGCACCGYK